MSSDSWQQYFNLPVSPEFGIPLSPTEDSVPSTEEVEPQKSQNKFDVH